MLVQVDSFIGFMSVDDNSRRGMPMSRYGMHLSPKGGIVKSAGA